MYRTYMFAIMWMGSPFWNNYEGVYGITGKESRVGEQNIHF